MVSLESATTYIPESLVVYSLRVYGKRWGSVFHIV